MEQDWEKIVIHGQSKNINKCSKNDTICKPISTMTKQQKQIDLATDAGKLKQISLEDRQQLISHRVAKGMKQDQIAQALSMPVNLYKDIESGKIIPTQPQLNKINNYLKTNIKLT